MLLRKVKERKKVVVEGRKKKNRHFSGVKRLPHTQKNQNERTTTTREKTRDILFSNNKRDVRLVCPFSAMDSARQKKIQNVESDKRDENPRRLGHRSTNNEIIMCSF
jgi:hypothetical protein